MKPEQMKLNVFQHKAQLRFRFHHCQNRQKHFNNGEMQPHAALTIRSICICLISQLQKGCFAYNNSSVSNINSRIMFPISMCNLSMTPGALR